MGIQETLGEQLAPHIKKNCVAESRYENKN
jgi:hypothetical protein